MANVTAVSTNYPALTVELTRLYMNAERALTTPETNVTMTFGDTLITCTGSLPVATAVDAASGNLVTTFTDRVPDADPVVTGTPIAGITTDKLAEALYASVVGLDAAEAAYIAGGQSLPAGVGSTLGQSGGLATFTAVVPYSVSFDNAGRQIITVQNYLA